ncbi:MAG: hypothetical protein AAF721_17190 [Myxococcota bacterium]
MPICSRLETVPSALALSLSLSVLASAGCDLGEPTPGTFSGDNNNTMLDVSDIPAGADVERVVVPVEVLDGETSIFQIGDPAITVGDATIVRGAAGTFAKVYAEVTNDGDTPLCSVHAERVDYLDGAGEVLQRDLMFVQGSSAVTSDGDLTFGNCLAADGGFGVFATIVEGVEPEQVQNVQMTVVATDATEFNAAQADVLPVSIDVGAADTSAELTIRLENQGSGRAVLDFVKVVFFDASGEFLDMTFADEFMPQALAAGETGTATASTLGTPGLPTQVMVHVDWTDIAQ